MRRLQNGTKINVVLVRTIFTFVVKYAKLVFLVNDHVRLIRPRMNTAIYITNNLSIVEL